MNEKDKILLFPVLKKLENSHSCNVTTPRGVVCFCAYNNMENHTPTMLRRLEASSSSVLKKTWKFTLLQCYDASRRRLLLCLKEHGKSHSYNVTAPPRCRLLLCLKEHGNSHSYNVTAPPRCRPFLCLKEHENSHS